MALKATVQKEGSKQSLPEVSSEAFFKIDFLKNFAIGKHLCWKRLQHRCFPVNIAKFLRTLVAVFVSLIK